jgi:hypothetical protein
MQSVSGIDIGSCIVVEQVTYKQELAGSNPASEWPHVKENRVNNVKIVKNQV